MRCNNQALMKLISNKALTQDTEVDFNLLENLPDCKKLSADKYVDFYGVASYDPYKVPENKFECMRAGCINSGLLSIEPGALGSSTATYFLAKDATEYAAGVLTFYVGDVDVSTPAAINVTLSSDNAFTNADTYDFTISEIGADGFTPIVVDLSQPATEAGLGWQPSPAGTYIRIGATDRAFGISSIAVFDAMSDFATNDVVKIRCLSGIEGSFDIPALEATCTASGYDTSGTSGFDFTITGRLMSANYNKLNPLEGKGSAVQGFDISSVEKTVEAFTVGTKNYGRIKLADAYQNECGYMSVQIADSCDVTNATLVMLTIPTLVDVDGGHYQVIKNADGTTDLIFNENHVGRKVLISYPISAEVEEMVGSMDNVGNVRVRMSYLRELSDGTKYRFVYNNVLVTSFPAGITNEEADVSFTINVQKDNDGLFYHKYRILG